MSDMTYREMNLAVFAGQPIPHVLFQPRFEPWFDWHQQFESLPERLREMSMADVYRDVDCSQRYMHYFTGLPSPIQSIWTEAIPVTETEKSGFRTKVYHTPHGDLTEVWEYTVDRTWRRIEFMGKSTDDLEALLWLIERQSFEFDAEAFKAGSEYLADRGEPQFWVPKSPYLSMAQQWMRFEAFIYALADEPEQVERLMQAIDASHDAVYEQLCASGVRLLNFGENIAQAHMNPSYFERYLLPWYEKRVGQLRAANIYTHIHIDGYFRELIEPIRKLPHDGLEALTPLPQGDVTLDELERALNGKVLLDGIPAILFLEHHPMEQLQACVEDLCRRFGGRMALGISDELPQGANEEGYRRMKWVADYAREYKLG